jgi:hypothetical protein
MSKNKFEIGERVIIQIPDLNGKLINVSGYVISYVISMDGSDLYTISSGGFNFGRRPEEIMKYPKKGDIVLFELATVPGGIYKRARVVESPTVSRDLSLSLLEGEGSSFVTTIDRIKFISDEGESESKCVKQSNEVLYNRLVVLISDRDKVNKQLSSIESEMDCIIKQLAKEIK